MRRPLKFYPVFEFNLILLLFCVFNSPLFAPPLSESDKITVVPLNVPEFLTSSFSTTLWPTKVRNANYYHSATYMDSNWDPNETSWEDARFIVMEFLSIGENNATVGGGESILAKTRREGNTIYIKFFPNYGDTHPTVISIRKETLNKIRAQNQLVDLSESLHSSRIVRDTRTDLERAEDALERAETKKHRKEQEDTPPSDRSLAAPGACDRHFPLLKP